MKDIKVTKKYKTHIVGYVEIKKAEEIKSTIKSLGMSIGDYIEKLHDAYKNDIINNN